MSNPRFKTPAGKFRGNPTRAKYNKFGLQCIVVSPTRLDRSWVFSDTPCKDDDEFMEMMHAATQMNDKRTAEQRLKAAVTDDIITDQCNYDSKEIGIECFNNNGWPEKTDLKCWWCLHGFDTRPFPCPYRMDREGVFHINGVFCGPSCAKAWARHDGRFTKYEDVAFLIDKLAKMRGFNRDGKRLFIAREAPPRQSLEIFRGAGNGLSIEQFRGLCDRGFDVTLLNPPYITHKQIIVADCERQVNAIKKGRVCHIESVKSMSMPAMEAARHRKEGFEIFAGVGVKRLKDFLTPSPSISTAAPTAVVPGLIAPATAPVPTLPAPTLVPTPPAPTIMKDPATTHKRSMPDPFEQMQKVGYVKGALPMAPPTKRGRRGGSVGSSSYAGASTGRGRGRGGSTNRS